MCTDKPKIGDLVKVDGCQILPHSTGVITENSDKANWFVVCKITDKTKCVDVPIRIITIVQPDFRKD
jgi:hypothetical protein